MKNGNGTGRRRREEKEPGQQTIAPKKPVSLVTGPTSGIGRLLIKKLLASGHQVRVLVRSSETLNSLPPGVIPHVADITLSGGHDDQRRLEEACTGVRYVFHLAAITNLKRASLDEFINTNVIGTENVLRACVDANPAAEHIRFIYLSSTEVYGKQRQGEIITEDSELRPTSSYGQTKHMAEEVIRAFEQAHPKIEYTIFRTSTMYGPYYEGSFNKIFRLIKQQKMKYIGQGLNHLTLIHVDDVVKGITMSMDNPRAFDRTYNLTDGKDYTLKLLFEKAAMFLNVPAPSKSIHPTLVKLASTISNVNPAEIDFLMSDRIISIDRITNDIGFKPEKNIDKEGQAMVKEFLAKYKA